MSLERVQTCHHAERSDRGRRKPGAHGQTPNLASIRPLSTPRLHRGRPILTHTYSANFPDGKTRKQKRLSQMGDLTKSTNIATLRQLLP